MDINEWLLHWVEVKIALTADLSEPARIRSVLFGTWLMFHSAPKEIHDTFEAIDESDIAQIARPLGETLACGQTPTCPSDTADLAEVVLFVAALLRGLELSLIALGSHRLSPRHANSCKVQFGSKKGWLLPFPPAFRSVSDGWPRGFAKRGLQQMRCIPEILPSGISIDLNLAPAITASSLNCAGGLFPALSHQNVFNDSGADGKPIRFVAAAIDQDKNAEDILAILDAAMKGAGSDLVVLPELSVDQQHLPMLQRALREKRWKSELTAQPNALVVAGSWHIKRGDGKYQNVAPVFDRDGNLIGEHAKTIAYTDPGLVEFIAPSNRILVVATPTLTISVAICLDFCQEGRLPNPYDELDVDLVLVTSFANQSTLDGHVREAERIWNNRKTATFLAQQMHSVPFGTVGALPGMGFDEAVAQLLTKRTIERPPKKVD